MRTFGPKDVGVWIDFDEYSEEAIADMWVELFRWTYPVPQSLEDRLYWLQRSTWGGCSWVVENGELRLKENGK